MRPEPVTAEALGQQLDQLATDLQTSVDALTAIDEEATAEHAQLMEGELRHFPKEHQDLVLENLKQEKRRERQPIAEDRLYHLEHFLIQHEATVPALKAAAQRPPTAEESVLARSRQIGINLSEHLAVQTLDELRYVRLQPIVQSSPASAQLAAYTEALADPDESYNSALIRIMESAHLNGFSGSKPENPQEAQIAAELRKMIQQTRAARVPVQVSALETKFAQARRSVSKAKDLRRLQPRRPHGK